MIKNFSENFFKKVLDINEELVYNVPVATKQEERNKEKHELEKSSRKIKKVLDKVSEL